MGKKRFKNKRERIQKSENSGGGGWYVLPEKESALFEKYYKEQKIAPESEWNDFMETLKRELPASFRLNSSLFKSELLNLVREAEVEGLEGFKVLDWYPDSLAFQLATTKKELRKTPVFKKLHQFLVGHCETGDLSRQETVSMIPPLLMDVHSDNSVLDMCAAPGSKTAQLIEKLHKECENPTGFILANDKDNERCYLLCHQSLKRFKSPCCLVVNNDASFFPNITLDGYEKKSFDRVLCDVICSGDGTLRKNPDLWHKWSPMLGFSLHGLQYRIARRGLEVLAVGGIMVYSTCSLNPVENEAVLVHLLTDAEGSIELVDVENELPGLIRSPGMKSWKIMGKDGTFYDSHESVPVESKRRIQESFFPRSSDEMEKLQIEKSFRILPHKQDTGGFFVAVFKKTRPLPWTSEAKNDESVCRDEPLNKAPRVISKKPSKFSYNEAPFLFLDPDDKRWTEIKNHYGISESFPASQLFSRSKDGESKGVLYFVNHSVEGVLANNSKSLKFINAGVKMFGRVEQKYEACRFRLAQDGVSIILPYLTKRSLEVPQSDMINLITPKEDTAKRGYKIEDLSLEVRKIIESRQDLMDGSIVFWTTTSSATIALCVWRGKFTITPYASKEIKENFLKLLRI